VDLAYLTGQLVLDAAGSFLDIDFGKGVILVDLGEAHMDRDLVGQLAATRVTLFIMEDREETHAQAICALVQQLADAEQRFDTKLAMERDAQKCIIDAFHEEIEDLDHNMHGLQEGNRKIQTLQDEIRALQDFTKRGFELSNKVKKRVALAIARMQVVRSVGRIKGDTETWSAVIHCFSVVDWRTVGVIKKMVHDLFADGAYVFNESIHSISCEEVVGSIASMR
jgi:hypothetical protein